MSKSVVLLRSEEGGLGVLVPHLLTSGMNQADVKIITADGFRFMAHSCVLSASPVLSSCLRLVDVRVGGDSLIHLDFSQTTVRALIHFLYTGSVQMKRSFKSEFNKLCATLRLNPPVTDDNPYSLLPEQVEDQSESLLQEQVQDRSKSLLIEQVQDRSESLLPDQIQDRSEKAPALSSSELDSVLSKSSNNENMIVNPEVNNEDVTNVANLDTRKNDNDLDKFISPSFNTVAKSEPAVCDKETNGDKTIVESTDKLDKLELNPGEVNVISTEPGVPDTFYCDICFKIFTSNSARDKHLEAEHIVGGAEHIAEGDQDRSYDETPESISVFLDELNKVHGSKEEFKDAPENIIEEGTHTEEQSDSQLFVNNNEESAEDENDLYPELENDHNSSLDSVDRSDNEFKMPENFDIPQDYIQEIVPKKSISLQPEELLANLGVPTNPIPLNSQSLTTKSSTAKPVEPVRVSPELITYYSRDTNSKSTKTTKRHLSGDSKRNRKHQSYVIELFGECSQESEGPNPDTPKVRKEFESCGGTATILTENPKSENALAENVDLSILDELQDKVARVKKRLVESDSDNPIYKEKRKKKKKKRQKEKDEFNRSNKSAEQSHSKPPSSPSPAKHPTSSQSKLSSSSQSKHSSSKSSSSSLPKSASSSHTKSKSSPVSKVLDLKPKAPFKFEDDNDWLVPDDYEDSNSDRERNRKDKKKKKKKKLRAESDENVSSEEDERRKRLDERKQKRGGDVLAWMTKKAKISVKFQDEGKEKILDKAIYIMKLIGSDSDGSSDNDKKLHRKRDFPNSDAEEKRSRSSSPHSIKKRKKKKKKRTLSEKQEKCIEPETETKKFKRSVSVQEEKRSFLPVLNRSISTCEAVASFKIPKLAKPKPSSET